MKKRKIVLNRPIQIGVTILEISKLIMYTYYFDVLKSSFGSRIKLLYTDTDSYIVELTSRNLLEDLKRDCYCVLRGAKSFVFKV